MDGCFLQAGAKRRLQKLCLIIRPLTVKLYQIERAWHRIATVAGLADRVIVGDIASPSIRNERLGSAAMMLRGLGVGSRRLG
jgi:hypothetical protein